MGDNEPAAAFDDNEGVEHLSGNPTETVYKEARQEALSRMTTCGITMVHPLGGEPTMKEMTLKVCTRHEVVDDEAQFVHGLWGTGKDTPRSDLYTRMKPYIERGEMHVFLTAQNVGVEVSAEAWKATSPGAPKLSGRGYEKQKFLVGQIIQAPVPGARLGNRTRME